MNIKQNKNKNFTKENLQPKSITTEGKTVNEAVTAALDKLALRREHVDVEIISEGSRGFFGLGESPAKVLVREKQWRAPGEEIAEEEEIPAEKPQAAPREPRAVREARPPRDERRPRSDRGERGGDRGADRGRRGERDRGPRRGQREDAPSYKEERDENIPDREISLKLAITDIIPADNKFAADKAKYLSMEIAAKMGASVTAQHINWDDTQKRILIDFEVSNPHIFTSNNCETLEAFQYLVTLALAKDDINIPVRIDINYNYQKQERKLLYMVDKAVNNVKYGKKAYRLEPMPPAMRKFIHKLLENNPDVKTVSEGESKWRKVVIMPKTAADIKGDSK